MLLNHTSIMARPRVDQARLREGLIYVLLAMLVALVTVGGWLTYRFAMPVEPPWITVGTVTQYPPRASPYWVRHHEVAFFLVNDGESLFTLYPRTNAFVSCTVLWDAHHAQLHDPCLGAYYSRYGDFTFRGPSPNRGLDRFPVRVTENHEIEVYPEPVLNARTPAQVEQFCRDSGRRLLSASLLSSPWSWIRDECDFRALAYSE